jgi:hypothetical protein
LTGLTSQSFGISPDDVSLYIDKEREER